MARLQRLGRAAGFTIIEAMIAVAVAAIAAAFVIPAYDSFKVKSRVAASADQFAGLMAAARNLAATRQRTVFVTRTSDATGEYYSVRLNANNNTVVESQFANRSDSRVVITRNPVISEVRITPAGLMFRTDTNAVVDWSLLFCDNSVVNEKGRTVKIGRMGRTNNVENTTTATCNP